MKRVRYNRNGGCEASGAPSLDEAQREANWGLLIRRCAVLTQENLILVDRCEKLQDALDRSIAREAKVCPVNVCLANRLKEA